MRKGYYEAILQLRNINDDVFGFICRQINKEKAGVARQENVRNGIDLYLASQKFARKLGKTLIEHFGGILKITAKLYSRDRQTSRNLYRVSVLFKCLDFIKGDVVMTEGKVFRITAIGKKITGKDLITGKKKKINLKNKVEVLEAKKTIVSKTRPRLEVIHPETFQSVPVANPKELKLGEKIKVVVYNEAYLV